MLAGTALLTPIMEAMDHWDPPGLDNDTEMRAFAFVLLLSLIVLVSKLLATIQLMAPRFLRAGTTLMASDPLLVESAQSGAACAFEAFSPPLRI